MNRSSNLRSSNLRSLNLKNFIAILLVVMFVIVSFFVLIRNEIIHLSRERLSLIAEDNAENISTWAGKILGELEVYKDIAVREGSMNRHTFELLSTSFGANAECPYGIYWGNQEGEYFDSSGWVPQGDFDPTTRRWYEEGLNHIHFEMGEPYIDEMTGASCVSASVRMILDGEESVMATDVYLEHVSQMVSQLTTQEIEKTFFVTRRSRIIVADSDVTKIGQKLAESDVLLYQKVNDLIERHFLGQTIIEAEGTYYVNLNQIENTDWIFVTCMNGAVLTENLRRAEFIMLFLGLAVFAVLILLTYLISQKMNEADQRAKSDPLTNLLNRNGFKGMCVQMMKNNPKQGLLMIMDMDNFKRINDQLGHPEGDKVLREFAELLGEYFNRNSDFTARLGGDEFAVFVGRKAGQEDTAAMLDKFLQMFHQKYDERYRKQQLSISIGIAFAEDCAGDFNELYRCADHALYTAKQNGKDCYAFES